MKSVLLLSVLFLTASCGGAQDDAHSHEGEGAHSHADGSTHADHADTTGQESFSADSTHAHGDSTHTH